MSTPPPTLPGLSTVGPRKSHLQLQDEDDLGLVLKDLVQGDDVGMMDLLQDVHLALNILPGDAAATGLAAPLLDELGGVLDARASVSASSDHSKLTAGGGGRRGGGGGISTGVKREKHSSTRAC